MKKIEVNIGEQTVSVFNEDRRQWEKIDFEEAGLMDEGCPSHDEAMITETLEQRFLEETEIEFLY